ncbi:hypothetical protein ACHAWF_015434 [Thalassiosira exigua]
MSMMKLPWSKSKQNECKQYSASVTNGILRNSKWGSETSGKRNCRNHVTFRISRVDTQLNLDTIRAVAAGAELELKRQDRHHEKNRLLKLDSSDRSLTRENKHRSDLSSDFSKCSLASDKPGPEWKPKRKKGDSNSNKMPSGRRRLSLLIDEKIETKLRRNSQEDDGSMDSNGLSLHKTSNRMNDISQNNASNNEANVSEGTSGKWSRERTRLSLLIDEKTVAKVIEADESDSQRKERTRLSELLDEKIATKIRRESQELLDDVSSSDGSLPSVHKVRW